MFGISREEGFGMVETCVHMFTYICGGVQEVGKPALQEQWLLLFRSCHFMKDFRSQAERSLVTSRLGMSNNQKKYHFFFFFCSALKTSCVQSAVRKEVFI